MYGIYLIYNNNELIYVGKTINFEKRIKNHMSSQPWSKEITHVKMAICKNKIDMDIYEKYYINKLKPKYNKASVYNEAPSFKIEALKFKKFELDKFLNETKNSSTPHKKNNCYEKRRNEISEKIKNSLEINEFEKLDLTKVKTNLFYWKNVLKNEFTFLEIKYRTPLNLYLNCIRQGKAKLIDNKYILKFQNGRHIYDNFTENSPQLNFSTYYIYNKIIKTGWSGINLVPGVNYFRSEDIAEIHMYKRYLDEYFIY